MKILLDTCVWGGVVQELRAAGHDVVWTGDWQEDPGMMKSSNGLIVKGAFW